MAHEVVLHGLGCGLVWGFGLGSVQGMVWQVGLGWDGTRSSTGWG